MATQNRPTLLDVAKMTDPDGTSADIVEVLMQSNVILQDAPAYSSNAPMGNRVTLRNSLPTIAWSKINQGIARSKGSTRQLVDTIGLLVGLSEVDARLLHPVGQELFNAQRFTEDKGYLEAFSQEIAGTMLYGNELTAESEFTGLQPRLETPATAITGSQVRLHHSAPSGADNTSIYVIDWSEDFVHMIYPKGSTAGIMSEDQGKIRVTDVDGNPFMAFVTEYSWFTGLTVKDPRHIARLANIDISQALADTTTQLMHSMVRLLNGMPEPMGAQRILYTHRDIISALEIQVKSQANVWLSMDEYLGAKTLHFRGFPLRKLDQMSGTETTVS